MSAGSIHDPEEPFYKATVESQSPKEVREDDLEMRESPKDDDDGIPLVLLDMETQTDKLKLNDFEIQVRILNELSEVANCIQMEISPLSPRLRPQILNTLT